MKKIIMITLAALILVPSFVSAQGTQQQKRIQDPSTHESGTSVPQGNQVQNQVQVQTQNQGEATQLQVATQQMEQLMEMEGLEEGVSNQVRTIAQEQVQSQIQIQTQISRLESRSGLRKRLFGPDYGAIKNLKQQMDQNELRIQRLEQLQNQVTNRADEAQLQEATQALVEQNTNLEEQIQAEEQVRSIFGWLVKLFII
ncbi:MAG TPA: hypothetical protein VMW41_02225 [Candidatus Bathyarchaeia archaeon]|nr:hypothetical protein [Candidatus Bathyarchaeia archaeon]